MDWLEDELRQALRRQEPSPDFEARVTQKVTSTVRGQVAARHRPVLMMPRWLAAAAAVVVIAGAGAGYRHHQGQVAKEQVMLAMRLAGSQLNRIQVQMKAVRP
jgi:type VI protein secretion system component VasF